MNIKAAIAANKEEFMMKDPKTGESKMISHSTLRKIMSTRCHDGDPNDPWGSFVPKTISQGETEAYLDSRLEYGQAMITIHYKDADWIEANVCCWDPVPFIISASEFKSMMLHESTQHNVLRM